jgi:two-component system sensor histidine kinase HydH
VLLRSIRPQDFVWLFLFSAMALLSPTRDASEAGLLAALAVAQVVEPKIAFLSTTRGKVAWIVLKLAIGYVLIGYTGGLTSHYYLILLLPVISAATSLGVLGTLLFIVLACGSYLSFLLFVNWARYSIDPDQVRLLILRLVFLGVAGNLVNILAEALRVQSGKYRAVAEQLADANRSLREAEAAVRRSERLAALGQLSAGLAHELRNPLGTIKASAEMLSRGVSAENEVAREVTGFISSEVDRTNALVTRFLEFARPLQPRLEPADLAHVIDRAVELLERDAAKQGVTIYKNYSPGLAPLPMDAELMERVFCNLLLNAIQATATGGAVTVKTRNADGAVEISVIDRGAGIEPRLLENIFNPFFTTKPQGVGLGLAIVSKILDEHGARISVESEPGKGSVFRVYLPFPPNP